MVRAGQRTMRSLCCFFIVVSALDDDTILLQSHHGQVKRHTIVTELSDELEAQAKEDSAKAEKTLKKECHGNCKHVRVQGCLIV